MEIRSYLLAKGKTIKSMGAMLANLSDYFVEVEGIPDDQLERVLDVDQFYIEGCIVMENLGEKVLDFQHWDVIDSLWAYLIDRFHQIACQGKDSATFSFPDQPLEVSIRKLPQQFLLSIGGKITALPEKELLLELAEKGQSFFEKIGSIFTDRNQYQHEFKMLAELRDCAEKS